MSRVRPRPTIHRHEPVRDPVNEADVAKMFDKLNGRIAQQQSRRVSGSDLQRQVAGANPASSATQLGLSLRPTGLTAESPGPPTAEETCSAGGGSHGPHGPFPALATGTESSIAAGTAGQESGEVRGVPSAGKTPHTEPSAVSKAIATAPGSLASTGQPRRILEWEKPVECATAVKTKDGRYSCCKVIVDGKARYEAWKLIPAGTWFRPLAQNLNSFAEARRICQKDADG